MTENIQQTLNGEFGSVHVCIYYRHVCFYYSIVRFLFLVKKYVVKRFQKIMSCVRLRLEVNVVRWSWLPFTFRGLIYYYEALSSTDSYFVFLTALECSPRASYRAELGVSIEYEYPKRDGNNMGYFNRVHKHLCYNRSYYISLILKWVSYTWKLVFVQRFIISFIKQMPPRWRNWFDRSSRMRKSSGIKSNPSRDRI